LRTGDLFLFDEGKKPCGEGNPEVFHGLGYGSEEVVDAVHLDEASLFHVTKTLAKFLDTRLAFGEGYPCCFCVSECLSDLFIDVAFVFLSSEVEKLPDTIEETLEEPFDGEPCGCQSQERSSEPDYSLHEHKEATHHFVQSNQSDGAKPQRLDRRETGRDQATFGGCRGFGDSSADADGREESREGCEGREDARFHSTEGCHEELPDGFTECLCALRRGEHLPLEEGESEGSCRSDGRNVGCSADVGS
jgi:hypothetical protein